MRDGAANPVIGRRTAMAGLSALLGTVLVPRVHAAESANSAQVIRIGFRPAAPMVMETPNGLQGLEVDIVSATLAEAGFRISPYIGPHARLAAAAARGDIDGIAPLVGNITGILPTDPYLSYQNVVMTLAERRLQIRTPGDLRGLRVLVFQRAAMALGDEFAAAMENNPDFREEPKQDRMALALLSGRCDAVIADRRMLLYQINKARRQVSNDDAVAEHTLFPPVCYSAGFRDPSLVAAFNKGLAVLKDDQRYDAILARHAVG